MNSYDPMVIFDDVSPAVLGAHGVAGAEWRYDGHCQAPRERDVLGVARAIARRARKWRLHAPIAVVGLDGASTRGGFTVLGADEPTETGLPLFDGLHARFVAALPTTKLVRLDDAESYANFRKERRQPYLDLLAKRVSALEAAYAAHAEEDAAHFDAIEDGLDALVAKIDQRAGDPDAVERAGQAVLGALMMAPRGGQTIKLPLPPWARGEKVECWQDGGEILCSVKVAGEDGALRFATAGAPLAPTARVVMGCAMSLDAEVDEVVGLTPRIAQVLSGERLLQEMCGAASKLIRVAGGKNFVGALVPLADAKVAAGMALLQRAQRGDRRALKEARALHDAQRDFVADAGARLVAAQAAKGGR